MFSASGSGWSMAKTLADKVCSGPGPGHYSDTGRRRTPRAAYGFGTSRREPGNIVKTPGPGQYALGSTLGGAKHSLTPRRVVEPPREIDCTPGPGAHDHNSAFTNDPP